MRKHGKTIDYRVFRAFGDFSSPSMIGFEEPWYRRHGTTIAAVVVFAAVIMAVLA